MLTGFELYPRWVPLTFYYNFGRAEENCSLYRYTGVRYIEVPLYKQKHTPTNSSKTKAEKQKNKCGLPQPKKHVRTTSKQTHAKQSIYALLQPRQKHKHNPVSEASIKAHVTQKQVSKTSHQTRTEQK